VKGSVLRAGFAVAVGNLFVNFANVGRDVAIAMAFGSSLAVDSFFLATMVPIFLLTVGASAYRNSIVPILERLADRKGTESARTIIGRLLTINVPVLFLIGGVLAVCVHWYAPLLAGRLPDSAGRLIEVFTWATLPMFLLSGYASLAEGPLQSQGRFFLPSVTRAGLPLGIAIGSVLLGGKYGILGACIGGLVGAALQLVLTCRLLYGERLWASLRTPLDQETSSALRTQFLPLAAGASIMYVSPIIDQWMASLLGAGSVSVLSYANRLVIGAASIIAGAIGPALLPRLSRLAINSSKEAINKYYFSVAKLMLWGGCLMTGVIWLFSEPAVALLYERGSFVRGDTIAVAHVLGYLALQLPVLLPGIVSATMLSAWSLNSFFVPLNLLNAALNVIGNWVLMQWFGLAGIAISTAMTYLVSTIALNVVLYKRGIISVPPGLSLDLIAPIGIAVILSVLILAADAKPAVAPTLYQAALSTLALFAYSALTYYFTRPLSTILFRGLWPLLKNFW
jgi:putative peptidoglycan lipid II flippase